MLEPGRLALVLVGIAVTALALSVFLLDVQRRAHRAFGAIMALRGLNYIAAGFMGSISVQMTGALLSMQPYLLLPLVPLAIYFLSVFPDRRGPLAFRGSGWCIFGTIIALEIIYLLYPQSVHSLALGAGASGFASAGPGWIFTSFGPLSILIAGSNLVLSLLALAYAWEYVKSPNSRNLHAVVASGFILNGIFDGGLAAAALIEDGSLGGLSGYGLAFPILRALALLPAAIALGMIINTQREESGPSRIHWVLPGLAVLALLSGPIPIIMGVSGYGLTWHSLVILSLWRLVMPVTVGYALIRSGMLEHVRLPHLWPRGHSKTAARPAASARSTED